ncbi:hypothetical protein C2G38_2144153 [Gigaspora rosea]|uniref:Restriction endonuclease type IV Mrr domain-containing protein n=1 Tax=Gigaspora rosea TaxID=44941 RepID=A0A397V4L0_9GLOM|nr:hypothetical protein C2G38_2144153 [Gigaspora rosea]
MPSSESAAISVVIEEVEIGEFIDYVKEEASSFEKGRNFEILCADDMKIGGPGDKGRDILVEICGVTIAVQCKAYVRQNVGWVDLMQGFWLVSIVTGFLGMHVGQLRRQKMILFLQ